MFLCNTAECYLRISQNLSAIYCIVFNTTICDILQNLKCISPTLTTCLLLLAHGCLRKHVNAFTLGIKTYKLIYK